MEEESGEERARWWRVAIWETLEERERISDLAKSTRSRKACWVRTLLLGGGMAPGVPEE